MADDGTFVMEEIVCAVMERLRGRVSINADAMNRSGHDSRRHLVVRSNEPFSVGDSVRVCTSGWLDSDVETEVEEKVGLTGLVLAEELPECDVLHNGFVEQLPAPLRDYLPEGRTFHDRSWDGLDLVRQMGVRDDDYPLWAALGEGMTVDTKPDQRTEQHNYSVTACFRLSPQKGADEALRCARCAYAALEADPYLDGTCWNFRIAEVDLRLERRGAIFYLEARRAALRKGA